MANLDYVRSTLLGQPTPRAVVGLANHLLSEFSIPTIIEDVSDISAALFVVLYESLFSDRLPGIIRQPVTKEDEIHNCQVVIDVLATDVVRDNLNHIRGADIVAGNITSISNLLDIFQCLLEYVVNKIESDIERDDTRSISTVDSESCKPSSKRPPQKKGQISKKKSHNTSKTLKSNVTLTNRTNNNGKKMPLKAAKSEPTRPASLNKNENRKAFDDHTIINHEDYFTMTTRALPSQQSGCPPSPIKADQSQSFLGQKTIDSEFDADLEKAQKQTFISSLGYPKCAWDDKLKEHKEADLVATNSLPLKKPETTLINGSADYVTSAPVAHATALPDTAASRLPSSRMEDREQPDHYGSTGSLITYHPLPTADKPVAEKTTEIKGLSSSYSDLRQLVEKTAALTRVALATSPIRHKDVDYLDITDVIRDRPKSKVVRLPSTEDADIHVNPNKEDVPSKSTKRVVFASQSDVGIQDRLNERSNLHPSKSAHRDNGYYSSTEMYTTSGHHRYNGHGSEHRELYREGRYPPADASPSNKLVTQKKPASARAKKQTLAKHLAANRQPELGAALMTLTNEDKALRQKQQILRQFYEKDHEDFTEDVDYMIGRDVQRADEVEEEFTKKCAEGKLKKKKSKGKISSFKKGKVGSKIYHKSAGAKRFVGSTPTLTIDNEEDLLPAMLEEFPHLHLSGHTWHELWRKSLHQIEALTRTYLASQRKKSNAQTQLEEAGGKHQLLSDLMKDQLEHHRRLQEIKLQKQQQIRVRNKVNEKRIQSARARCYYNEYQVRARAKQLKRRTKEEMVFRELFKDALNIQKERIQDIRHYANDLRKRQEMSRQNQIDSIENFYNDQFAMLAERLAKERLETGLRESAQQKLLERMKRELRKKMEEEIKQYQEQIFHDDDDVHFRQLDADRLRKHLHLARYSCKI